MPYDNVSEAEKNNPGLKKYSDKAKSGWLSAFNSCLKDSNDESKCLAIAYSVANKVDGKKASLESFFDIRNREDPNGINHDLRLTCAQCGTTQSCRCSKPKRNFVGLCESCAGIMANENINELGLPREKMVDTYKLQESDGAVSRAIVPRINTTDRKFGAEKQVYEVALLQSYGPEKVLGYVSASSREQAWVMVKNNPKYTRHGIDRLNVALAPHKTKGEGGMDKKAVAEELVKLAKRLTSGVWQLPSSPQSVAQLATIVTQLDSGNWPTRSGADDPVALAVGKHFGDDALFDAIGNAGDKYLEACAYAIRKRVKELIKDGPDSFQRPRDYAMLVELSKLI